MLVIANSVGIQFQNIAGGAPDITPLTVDTDTITVDSDLITVDTTIQ